MASSELEAPPGEDPEWDSLYLARGQEVPVHRPLYTGDVFSSVPLRTTKGEEKNRPVMVLQHPCTMRNGVALKESLHVAAVRPFKPLPRDKSNTNEKLMPLPSFRPDLTSNRRDGASFFEDSYFVHADALDMTKRVACLSEIGTYILLQRLVFHSSRVAPPVWQIEEMNGHVYAEADLLESWCEMAAVSGVDEYEALADADTWLNETVGNTTRRRMLRNSALRSRVQRELRQETKERYGPSATIIPLPNSAANGG